MRSILSLRPNSSLLLSHGHGYHDCSQAHWQAQAAGPPLVSRIAKKKNFSLFAVGGRRTPREEGRGEAGCRGPMCCWTRRMPIAIHPPTGHIDKVPRSHPSAPMLSPPLSALTGPHAVVCRSVPSSSNNNPSGVGICRQGAAFLARQGWYPPTVGRGSIVPVCLMARTWR